MSPQLTVTPELKTLLRRVKLGRCLDTLPERLTLAHQQKLTHHEFLEALLADEVTRRECSHALRAKTAGLDPAMLLDRWDDTAKITYDRTTWNGSLTAFRRRTQRRRHPRPGRGRQDLPRQRARTHRWQTRSQRSLRTR